MLTNIATLLFVKMADAAKYRIPGITIKLCSLRASARADIRDPLADSHPDS
jgi:hypothetical protein